MNKKSFTLVELLIVILIIGILAGIIVPKIITIDKKAQAAATKKNLDALRTAINFYKADYEVFPFSQGYPDNVTMYLPLSRYAELVPQYVPSIPGVYTGKKDAWGMDMFGDYHEGKNRIFILGEKSGFYMLTRRNCNGVLAAEYMYCIHTGEIWLNASTGYNTGYITDDSGQQIRWW